MTEGLALTAVLDEVNRVSFIGAASQQPFEEITLHQVGLATFLDLPEP
jgi:hypothetical protein